MQAKRQQAAFVRHTKADAPMPDREFRGARKILISSLSYACLMTIGIAGAAQAQQSNGVGMSVAGARPPDTPPAAGKVLETRAQLGAGQKPVTPKQTRAVAVIAQTPYVAKVVTEGLNKPWSLAFLPGDKILVTEKPGTMRIIDMHTGKIEKEVANVPAVQFGGDAGLLDVALDPKFAENRLLYFSYVESRSAPYEGAIKGIENSGPLRDNGITIARAKLAATNDKLEDVKTILHVTPSLPQTAHYGSRLIFDRQGYLYVSLGERFFYPTRGDAQSLFSYMGKVLRMTTDGHAAPGNPFDRDQEKEDHPLPEIWSYGHRNPQGLAIHPVTGELWESEHGPNGGDEINLIKAGANYGWPVIAYGVNYDSSKIDGSLQKQDRANSLHPTGNRPSAGLTAAAGMQQPVYYWDPATAPSGMTFYDGKLIPEWRNNLFVANLAGQHISRLVLDGTTVVGEERLLLDQHQRMRNIKEGSDGALWAITDEANGRLIRIGPKQD